MRVFEVRILVSACALLLAFLSGAHAQDVPANEDEVVAQAAAQEADGAPLSEDELEVLAAPIALYPDDMVALVIAASLYPLQIVEAARFLEQLEDDPDLEPSDDWDGSVIALLNYPDVINMMNDDLSWTQLLGEVAVNQQKDFLVAIQQLRDEAVASGVLETTEQVQVVQENNNVVIQSADPEVVYVPTYPPEMLYDPTYVAPPQPIVYSNPYPSYYYPTARFWPGFVTGAAFAAVVDWNDWGTWGGDVDVKVKIDGNEVNFNGGNKIDFDGGDIDINNIDRSKIDIDKNSFNKNEIKNSLKNNDFNNVSVKGNSRTTVRDNVRQSAKGKDVRANIESGLKAGGSGNNRQLKRPPSAGDRVASRPGNNNRPNARPGNNNRPTAKPGNNRPTAKPAAAKRPSATKKKVTQPKPGARADKRPAKPSVMGDRGKGKTTKVHSNRGHKARGGGSRGGGHKGGGRRGGRR